MSTRIRVLALYRDLQRLGRDYPDPSFVFSASTVLLLTSLQLQLSWQNTAVIRKCVFKASSSYFHLSSLRIENKYLTNQKEIEHALSLGEYIKKGISGLSLGVPFFF